MISALTAVESDPRVVDAVLAGTRIVGMDSCPLTLGECVQGRLPDGRFFLITSPIGLCSRAEFTIDLAGDDVRVDPPGLTKALTAVRRYLAEAGLPAGGALRVHRPLACGQGFGTSTGDISASLRAAAAAWGLTISPEQIARLAIAIEPTDGSMYPGCVAFAHREGVKLETLGKLPRFEAVVALPGDVVDTSAFDEYRRDYRYGTRDQDDLMRAWAMVRHANRTGDVALMAAAATISTRINEQLLPKVLYRDMRRFAQLAGIEGLMAAHSGTALALILDPNRAGYLERLMAARAFVAGLQPASWFQVGNDVPGPAARLRIDAAIADASGTAFPPAGSLMAMAAPMAAPAATT